MARIEGYISGLAGVRFPVDGRPYLQPTNNTYQRNFVELTEENFEQELANTWRKEARRLNSVSGDGVKLQLYVYLESLVNTNGAGNAGVRRTTTHRIQAANPIVDQAVEQMLSLTLDRSPGCISRAISPVFQQSQRLRKSGFQKSIHTDKHITLTIAGESLMTGNGEKQWTCKEATE
ncbi:hypothetical protein BGZ98_002216 [Dissophora globulifera]|nr:hypothetical protein BGZ98_002216 [Dissophora globulifera]